MNVKFTSLIFLISFSLLNPFVAISQIELVVVSSDQTEYPIDCPKESKQFSLTIYENDSVIYYSRFIDSINTERISISADKDYRSLIYLVEDSIRCGSDRFSTHDTKPKTRFIREVQLKIPDRFHLLRFPVFDYTCNDCIELDSIQIERFQYVLDFLEYECHVMIKVILTESELSKSRYKSILKLAIERGIDPARISIETHIDSLSSRVHFGLVSWDYGY